MVPTCNIEMNFLGKDKLPTEIITKKKLYENGVLTVYKLTSLFVFMNNLRVP